MSFNGTSALMNARAPPLKSNPVLILEIGILSMEISLIIPFENKFTISVLSV